MDQQTVLDTMQDQGIVAVLRSKSATQAAEVAHACVAGGVELIEITFSVPDAEEAIATVCREEPHAIVGAGTVLELDQAKSAHAAGACFIVGPTYNPEIAAWCVREGLPYLPGCMTVNEMYAAQKAGCAVVKLFPGSEFAPGFIKAVHAPLPTLKIMPTGGVSLDNAEAWIAAGAFCLGVGGNLTKLQDDGYTGITQRAKRYRELVVSGRGA